jgi:uncharacterized membrane protein
LYQTTEELIMMHWFFPVFPLMFFVFVALMAFRFRGHRRCERWHDGREDAQAIVRRRLANGEIDEAEYQRLKEILSK